VTGARDDLEPCAAVGQRGDDLLGRSHRRDRVELADRHQGGRRDTAELIDDVETAHQRHPVLVELAVLRGVRLPLLVR
jgi:hypothetical protein